MIKINKDKDNVPESLIPAYDDLFITQDGQVSIPQTTQTTHLRRIEVIDNSEYTDETKFNNRYKLSDITIVLKDLYNSKCAYCEMKVEASQVEHYRPKKLYYWLAYSWDNLILACSICNTKKGVNFELNGNRVVFSNTEINIRNINNSSASYDSSELPKMVNPEVTDPIGNISFTIDGTIASKDQRFAYTIDKCGIDRKWLNDERRRIIDVFERDVRSVFVDSIDIDRQKQDLTSIIKKFIRDAQDEREIFLAFRRYAISNGWLNDIVKSVN